jgi:hypothetical protein
MTVNAEIRIVCSYSMVRTRHHSVLLLRLTEQAPTIFAQQAQPGGTHTAYRIMATRRNAEERDRLGADETERRFVIIPDHWSDGSSGPNDGASYRRLSRNNFATTTKP